MTRCDFAGFMVALAVCLSFNAVAVADHHEGDEVKAAVNQFYAQMSSGKYEEALSHVKLGGTGYVTNGLLIGIPNERVRDSIRKTMEEDREKGVELRLRPQYVDVALHGNIAISTYLVDGTVKEADDDEAEREIRRGTLIWQQTDDGWKIIHWHVSLLMEEDD